MIADNFLKEISPYTGVSGYEENLSIIISDYFDRLCNEVKSDSFFNTTGVKRQKSNLRPVVMVAAHMDEIGLMVKDIDEKGFLHFTTVGGVDPRILPSMPVNVNGRKKLRGIIGVKPPHLLNGSNDEAYNIEDLHIDVGMKKEKVLEFVRIGDIITFASNYTELLGNKVSSRAVDDRAGIAVMLYAMEYLDRLKYNSEVLFTATVQEEVGTRGVATSAYSLNPDIGVVIDVTHAVTPDASKEETFDIEKPVIAIGPNMSPCLTNRLRQIAEENNIDYSIEVEAGPTGTDARTMQITRSGIPCVLIGIPLRYMHTPIETISVDTLRNTGRLLATFIASLEEGLV